MALFDRIKSIGGKGEGPAKPEGQGADAFPAAFTPDPAKAAKFFEKARTVHDTTNFEYATTLWLQGLRQDPTSMPGHEAFFQSAQAYAQGEKRDKPSKEQSANFGGKGPLEKYLEELLSWGVNPSDLSRSLRVLEAAAKLNLHEPGYWVGERALAFALRDRAKRSDLRKLMDVLKELHCFDLAVKAGEAAVRADAKPDGALEMEVRNLAAQSTMSRGGYEASGQAGGFRANLRNAEVQRRLIEENALVKSADAADRVVAAAKEDFEARSGDRTALLKYARALQDRGKPEDDKLAHDLLMKGFEEFHEFRFRQIAGEIRLKHARRKVSQIRQTAEANPADAEAAAKHRKAHEAFLAMELEELRLRSQNYPTDLGLKLDIGIRLHLLGRDEEAVPLFQDARLDPKNKNRALNYLGQSFLRMGWADEAVQTMREVLAGLETQNDEMGLEVRYNLMHALERRARDHKDLAAAEEAYKIASSIAVQQMGYRDVRAKRDDLQKLVKELKAG